MSFKMIREAEAVSRLSESKVQEIKHVQNVLGAESLLSVVESTDIEVTPQHYNQWLNVMMDIASEGGVDLQKRRNFEDVAYEVLDNDSLVDALSGGDSERIKQNIVNALWQSYKVSQAHSRVQDHVGGIVQRAREDEELASKLAGGFEQAFNAAKGIEDEETGGGDIAVNTGDVKKAAVHKQTAKNPYPPGTLRAMLWSQSSARSTEEEETFLPRGDELPIDDEEDFGDEVTVDGEMDEPSPEELASQIVGDTGEDEGDVEARVDDLEARVADLESDLGSSEESDVVAKRPVAFDDEEQTRTLFRQAITAPKEHLSAALKDVEAEGAKAFAALQMPQNPHPKKSPAHNAWAKGFKNAAKGAMGFNDRPREFTSKQSKKRK